MPAGTTLTAANLQALGASRLAALLLEISAGDATAKRRLRLVLAGEAGPGEAARQVAKRLASIASGRAFVERHKIRTLANDLAAQRHAIRDHIATNDPREAFLLTWRLVECAGPLNARSDDSDGALADIFRDAVQDLGKLAKSALLDPADLADRAFGALRGNSVGEWDGLVEVLAPSLGTPGLKRLKASIQAWQAEPVVKPPERERRVIGWSSRGNIYADELEDSHRKHASASVLEQIADAMGDVDAYIAQQSPKSRIVPGVAADIARRLLDAGRAQDAWKALEAVPADHLRFDVAEWEQVRIETLEALGRAEDAQAFRWERFLATLDTEHLRAYLRTLPEFEDFEAEQRALTHAQSFRDVHQALAFLVCWPDLGRASQLVLSNAPGLNGDIYEVLSPAADALEERYPFAATLLRRAMIDFTLNAARSGRYKHAARHLAACARLAGQITDYGGAPDHRAYEQALQAAHGRKSAFWQEVNAKR